MEDNAYLWDGSEPGWELVRFDGGAGPSYFIHNVLTKQALLSCDDVEHRAIVERMLAEGVRVTGSGSPDAGDSESRA